jgi:hypothetical protein
MIHKLETLLDKVAATIPQYDKVKQEVSASGVGWHIEHICLTIDKITYAVANSVAANYTWKFNFVRELVFTTGKIPRGRAQSPKSVTPDAGINPSILTEHIATTRKQIQLLTTLPKDNYFEHPFFGNLRLKRTIRFLEIHTQHHLDIIHDIIRKSSKEYFIENSLRPEGN